MAGRQAGWQAGRGNNHTAIAQFGLVSDRANENAYGFYAGAGGGPSDCVSTTTNTTTGAVTCSAGFPKPSLQKALPGKYGQLPDIAWLAEPFIGVVIVTLLPQPRILTRVFLSLLRQGTLPHWASVAIWPNTNPGSMPQR